MSLRIRSVAIATLLIIFARLTAGAQNTPGSAPQPAPRGEVRGRVTNTTSNTPLGNAAVEVTTSGVVSLGRASTNSDGTFVIKDLNPGKLRVRIRALGFTPRVIPVEVTPTLSSIDVGTVALTPAPVELQAVDVTGQRQAVEMTPDRNTYVVRDMPTTRGGTVLDVLRNVPSVDVDIETS